MRKLLLLIFCGSGLCQTGAELEAEPKLMTSKSVYEAVSKLGVDGRALPVVNLSFTRDAHEFLFKSGTFYFLSPILEKTVMAVFLGDGAYSIKPSNPHESNILGMVHGEKDLSVWSADFDSVVLMFTDDTFEELTKDVNLETRSSPEAEKVLARLRKTQDEDFKINFRLRLTRALTNGGDDQKGFFLAFPQMKKMPPMIMGMDPLGIDGLDFGSTRMGTEQTYIYASDERKGGFWYAQPLMGTETNPERHQYVDALHYEVDTDITGFENVTGSTKMKFKVLIPELRTLPLFLTGSLEISEISLKNEQDELLSVGVIQDLDTGFFFEEPLKHGAIYTLTMKYSGRKVLYDVGNGNYYVVARTRWYPNVGVFGDRADYKLIFRNPKAQKLVATGKLVKEYDEDGRHVTEWESDEPITVAGFNYGKFLTYNQTEKESNLSLSVHHQELVNENLIHDVMADAINSTRVFSHYFGKLPYTTLAMTQQTQAGYGQAWPSLVFLPYISFFTSTQRQDFSGAANDQIENYLAPHEVAHQWFGHQISGATYRDQWLEEGFSEFAAGLLVQHTMGWEESDKFWDYAHSAITQKVRGSKLHYHEVAPLSMGFRMSTQEAPAAYSILTYSKGAYVVHMLRMMMMDVRNRDNPDGAFIAMMKDYFATHGGKNIRTADFQAIVEKHMLPSMNATGNGSMDWFFNQWVHGTTLPKFESDFSIKKEGDKFRVTGSISQKGVPESFLVMMPIYADFGKGHLVKFASIPFKGEMSQPADWLIPFPKKPQRILINAHRDVLTLDGAGK